MVGVVDDVTEEKQDRESAQAPPANYAGQSFSPRQLARLLGIAETTVKRIAVAGGIEFLRSSRKDSRRFAPEQVLDYLRKNATTTGDFAAAARARDISGCLLILMEELLNGASMEELLDARVRPVAGAVNPDFMAVLLLRIPFLAPERHRVAFPALVVRAGSQSQWDAEFVRCLLRAHGHEVLIPADNVDLTNLADIAEGIRARVAVLLVSGEAHSTEVLSVAAEIARSPRRPAVCLWSSEHLRSAAAAAVTRIGSMRDLGAILRRL
jgi:hypothetical protein